MFGFGRKKEINQSNERWCEFD